MFYKLKIKKKVRYCEKCSAKVENLVKIGYINNPFEQHRLGFKTLRLYLEAGASIFHL